MGIRWTVLPMLLGAIILFFPPPPHAAVGDETVTVRAAFR